MPVPDYEIPDGGEYLWDWFVDLLAWSDLINDGLARKPVPRDLLDWAHVTGNVVNADEYAILRDMGAAWAGAMNEELRYSRETKAEREKPAKG